jgi:hypothetical protein
MAVLLREFIGLQYDRQQILELKQGNMPVVLSGVLQRADACNQNGRVYPRPILEREVERYKALVKERKALGECDHPESSVVELKNASHLVTDIWWEGNEVHGKVEILNTPSGNILRSLLESGITLGISSRGVGEVQKDGHGNDVVDESFVLICFDMVSEPSTHGAWLYKEGKQVNMMDAVRALPRRDRIMRIANEILRGVK